MIVGNADYVEREWDTLATLPKVHIVSVLGRDEGYTVKYNPLSEGVSDVEAQGNSRRQRVIFDRLSRVES